MEAKGIFNLLIIVMQGCALITTSLLGLYLCKYLKSILDLDKPAKYAGGESIRYIQGDFPEVKFWKNFVWATLGVYVLSIITCPSSGVSFTNIVVLIIFFLPIKGLMTEPGLTIQDIKVYKAFLVAATLWCVLRQVVFLAALTRMFR